MPLLSDYVLSTQYWISLWFMSLNHQNQGSRFLKYTGLPQQQVHYIVNDTSFTPSCKTRLLLRAAAILFLKCMILQHRFSASISRLLSFFRGQICFQEKNIDCLVVNSTISLLGVLAYVRLETTLSTLSNHLGNGAASRRSLSTLHTKYNLVSSTFTLKLGIVMQRKLHCVSRRTRFTLHNPLGSEATLSMRVQPSFV